MKMFYLKDQNSSGNVFFKAFNPYVKDVEWTGVLDRAAFWKDKECAETQSASLALEGFGDWLVKEVKFK